MAEAPEPTKGQPGIAEAALFGFCPRCGARSLFGGWTRFADRCRVCGLDLTKFNVGDGPAAFLTLILGTIVTALAITLELTVHPPFWLHILLWVPITIGAVVLSLRLAKGMLIASEYRNRAREGRIESGPPEA